MDSPYAAYIASAFGIAALVLAGMIAVILADHRRLRRDLARLGDTRDAA